MTTNELKLGRIVSTSYSTGPYIIKEVSGPCSCPSYLRALDGDDTPSEPHYHLTCVDVTPRPGQRDKDYWLNGYRADGTSVWSKDRLIFGDFARGTQQELF